MSKKIPMNRRKIRPKNRNPTNKLIKIVDPRLGFTKKTKSRVIVEIKDRVSVFTVTPLCHKILMRPWQSNKDQPTTQELQNPGLA